MTSPKNKKWVIYTIRELCKDIVIYDQPFSFYTTSSPIYPCETGVAIPSSIRGLHFEVDETAVRIWYSTAGENVVDSDLIKWHRYTTKGNNLTNLGEQMNVIQI